MDNKQIQIEQSVRDIYRAACLGRFVRGFALGIFQYTYFVFLFDHLGANLFALRAIGFLIILDSVTTFIMEIPTGALADHWGRKRTLFLCFLFGGIDYFLRTWTYFVPSINTSVLLASCSMILSGISYTLMSGTFSAWIVDSVRDRHSKHGHGIIMAKSYSKMMIGKIIGATIGISCFLNGVVFYAFALGCLAYLLFGIYCLVVMKETQSMQFYRGKFFIRQSLEEYFVIVKTAFRTTIVTKPLIYMILTTTSYAVLMHLTLFLWPIAMKENFGIEKMSLYWFALIFGSFLSSYIGTQFFEKVTLIKSKSSNVGITNAYLWRGFVSVCLVMAVVIFFLGFMSYYHKMTLAIFMICIIIFNFGYGYQMPADETLSNNYIPTKNSKERATILSFATMLANIVMLIMTIPSMGPNGKETAIGWMLPAGLTIVVSFVAHLLMRRHERRKVFDEIQEENGTCETVEA